MTLSWRHKSSRGMTRNHTRLLSKWISVQHLSGRNPRSIYLTLERGRCNVGMLGSYDEVKLPNDYFSALVQLKSLEKRLSKDSDLRERYAKTRRDGLSENYVVKVQNREETKNQPGKEWYLPHHPVVNANKPGKVRRVLKGTSKFQGVSLNKVLLTDPDFLHTLADQFPAA